MKNNLDEADAAAQKQSESTNASITPCAKQYGTIEVRVVDEVSNISLADQPVMLMESDKRALIGKTDIDGKVRFAGVEDKEYRLSLHELDENLWGQQKTETLDNAAVTTKAQWSTPRQVKPKQNHTVNLGDCITSIAFAHGVSPESIWEDERNVTLRKECGDPSTLCAGRVVMLPQKKRKELSVKWNMSYVLWRSFASVKFDVQFLDANGTPRSARPFKLRAGLRAADGMTDDEGVISCDIPADTLQVEISLDIGITCHLYTFLLGRLEPLSTENGQIARFRSLGVLPGDHKSMADQLSKQKKKKYTDDLLNRSYRREVNFREISPPPAGPGAESAAQGKPSVQQKQAMPPVSMRQNLEMPRNWAVRVRDPIQCGRDDARIEPCPYRGDGKHTDLQRVLLGDFQNLNLKPNFDSPNQTSRYDVLTNMKSFSTRERKAAVQDCRNTWNPVPPNLGWLFTGEDSTQQQAKGIIYISSGRSKWFGENMYSLPLVVWCIANGYYCDIVTDPEEFSAYRSAIRDSDNAARLLEAVRLHDPAKTPANVQDHLNVVAPANAAFASMPRGFGFARHIGMRWMLRRFQTICATADDNTVGFAERCAVSAMNYIFNPPAGSRLADMEKWLCMSFSPSTSGMRENLTGSAWEYTQPPPYNGENILANDSKKPLIVQQFTVWNAQKYALLVNPPNYNEFFVTGKEDVELTIRLFNQHPALLLCDRNLHLEKCRAESTPTPQKNAAMQEQFLRQIECLCPCFVRAVQERDTQTIRAVAQRYSVKCPAADAIEDTVLDRMIWETLRKMNLVLEQILVPSL